MTKKKQIDSNKIVVFSGSGISAESGLSTFRGDDGLWDSFPVDLIATPTGYSKQEFDQFCRLAHIWNRQKEATIIIEELAAVTNCAKASGYWGVLVNQSLGLGATIFATAQRGQEADKSIMNASSFLWICQHNTEKDATYIANFIGVSKELIPRNPLQYIVWSPSSGLLEKRGNVCFKKNRAVFSGVNPRGLCSAS